MVNLSKLCDFDLLNGYISLLKIKHIDPHCYLAYTDMDNNIVAVFINIQDQLKNYYLINTNNIVDLSINKYGDDIPTFVSDSYKSIYCGYTDNISTSTLSLVYATVSSYDDGYTLNKSTLVGNRYYYESYPYYVNGYTYVVSDNYSESTLFLNIDHRVNLTTIQTITDEFGTDKQYSDFFLKYYNPIRLNVNIFASVLKNIYVATTKTDRNNVYKKFFNETNISYFFDLTNGSEFASFPGYIFFNDEYPIINNSYIILESKTDYLLYDFINKLTIGTIPNEYYTIDSYIDSIGFNVDEYLYPKYNLRIKENYIYLEKKDASNKIIGLSIWIIN